MPDVKRRTVRHVMARHGLSGRRACRLTGLDRSTFQYPKRVGGDDVLRTRLRELAGERRRFGYRRLGILLAREGLEANHKTVFLPYREAGLAVCRRRGRKRALGTRQTLFRPEAATARRSADSVSRALAQCPGVRAL